MCWRSRCPDSPDSRDDRERTRRSAAHQVAPEKADEGGDCKGRPSRGVLGSRAGLARLPGGYAHSRAAVRRRGGTAVGIRGGVSRVKSVPFEPLDPGTYRELVRRALAEDFGWGDVTTETIIDREQKARGVIVSKSSCVLAGVDIAAEAFRQLDPAVTITINCRDAERCEPG